MTPAGTIRKQVQKKASRPPAFKSLDALRGAKLDQLRESLAGLVGREIEDDVDEQAEVAKDVLQLDDNSRKAFFSKLKQAVMMSDVVIEVLDARDPNGYRSKLVEDMIVENGKTLVLLLNKIDLVDDPAVVERWEKHLKQEFPVCCFRSVTTQSRSKHSTVKFSKRKATRTERKVLDCGYSPLGASDLMNLLNNYTRTRAELDKADMPTEEMVDTDAIPQTEASPALMQGYKPIIVSIVGMPNVGKSSVINSLMRNTHVVKTGNEPGVTRSIQTIQLTSRIKLVDTPGVIVETNSLAEAVLRGCIKNFDETIGEEAVLLLLKNHIVRASMFNHFKLSASETALSADCPVAPEDARAFLAHVCDARGLVKKGGIRDFHTAIKIVVDAWNNGQLKGWCEPPVRVAPVGSIRIVEHASPEFDIDKLLK